jgi:hypothetical protein
MIKFTIDSYSYSPSNGFCQYEGEVIIKEIPLENEPKLFFKNNRNEFAIKISDLKAIMTALSAND